MVNETWKDVVGLENLYKVSSHGRVWSKRRNQELKLQRVPNKKYYRAHFFVDGVYQRKQIGRVVYEAFLGEIPAGKQIDHIDGDQTNNHYSNLRAVNGVENQFNIKHFGSNPYPRTSVQKSSFCFSIMVNGERMKRCGFKTQLEAFIYAEKERERLAKKYHLFSTV